MLCRNLDSSPANRRNLPKVSILWPNYYCVRYSDQLSSYFDNIVDEFKQPDFGNSIPDKYQEIYKQLGKKKPQNLDIHTQNQIQSAFKTNFLSHLSIQHGLLLGQFVSLDSSFSFLYQFNRSPFSIILWWQIDWLRMPIRWGKRNNLKIDEGITELKDRVHKKLLEQRVGRILFLSLELHIYDAFYDLARSFHLVPFILLSIHQLVIRLSIQNSRFSSQYKFVIQISILLFCAFNKFDFSLFLCLSYFF